MADLLNQRDDQFKFLSDQKFMKIAGYVYEVYHHQFILSA